MLTIWGRLNSHNVKKVAWLAEELGIAYVRRDMGGAFGMDEAYLRLNPNALIPTIEEDDVVLWESNAILRYLAARHGGERLWPVNPAVRAIGDKWMDWQFAFADAQRDLFLNLVRRAPEARDHDAMARSVQAVNKMMMLVEDALSNSPWLSGADFGIGDIPMGVYAHSYFSLVQDRPALPATERWYEALKPRPGYAQNVMIPLT
ncbi:glutathione S-transferase [Sphingobium sp. H39-3-25]|uniref:glutathione S-transferase family protein n=1 Tax=Sphingobium arseniciresistens TaxID=3030834 RepID=UPI0023B9E120|nr:glutathione S-transferase [Sphingobium arseniciresistens]